jgi:FMN-dependent NADH-azoreductase
MKLLHIDSSALGNHSVSRELTADIVAQFKHARPDTRIRYRDLAAQPLPHWSPVADASDPDTLLGHQVMDEFLAAEVIVLGAPMYNFGIPSQLKAWIDRVMVAGRTFRYTAEGPQGLAGGRKVIVAATYGGQHPVESGRNFVEPYLRQVFGFIGIDDIEFIDAEGLNISPEQRTVALETAQQRIDAIALPLAA